MVNNVQDLSISRESYINFDGDNIRDAIRNRLTQLGIFTDQNYEGSNLSHFSEILSYVFSMLLFMLNQTASEGMFTEAQLYENINKIVKGIDYKPIGIQTPILSFSATVSNIVAGLYKIPRYSYVEAGGIRYSFSEDIIFAKRENTIPELLEDISREKLLYQGSFIEHPTIIARGNDNELINLIVGDSILVDHFNIDIYVKNAITQVWSKWEKTTSLFLSKAFEEKYEIRLNENKIYEIKFGNGINGKKLTQGDQIAIYYLKSDGKRGEISANSLNNKSLNIFDSVKFRDILLNTSNDPSVPVISPNSLSFDNALGSSSFGDYETPESIRKNAPGIFRSQFRVVTERDYETYIKTNFAFLISDVKVMNNKKFLDSYMKYYYDLGIKNTNLEERALFNQVMFSDSCNFNNVYVFVVPKTVGNTLTYISPSQKQLIIDTIREEQVLTSETIISDPVYISFDLALGDNEITNIEDINTTKLIILKTDNTKRSDNSIKIDVINVISSFFSRDNCKLGQSLDINKLNSDIVGIDGVNKVYTYREDINLRVEGIRLIAYNDALPNASLQIASSNFSLEDFQFPHWVGNSNLSNKIIIESRGSRYEGV